MFEHKTVLLEETINGLAVNPDGVYVDCTLGGGGHAEYLLTKLGTKGHLYAFDQDQQALEYVQKKLKKYIEQDQLTLIQSNFRSIKSALNEKGISVVDGIYYDLGVSSPQFDQADRGFSYRMDARLDMRMNRQQSLSAFEVVNEWNYDDLVRIIYRYGEEKFAKRIARRIEAQRKVQAIETTGQLAELVKEAIPAATRRSGGHPAKRTFQAIRIAVNDELMALEESLDQGLSLLSQHGRLAVISFHSLEDRLVKQMFKQVSSVPETPRNLPILTQQEAEYRLVNRKPIVADAIELAENRRAHSAKLRIIERVRSVN
ncbi:16S rRNA (cytosine(1402)-N(4))-methyltransferase RsmH [Facklamia hominis]|uniref:Ribosomal RNA small subunit methyltransferase H n=1 Tax=Facklamia hominis CCUG 36813 TaxID=883111 RepID=K1M143_9LACT|nr:16S rRNA (cytosine(1402)-N(4))-methyltransferase RsmH [Facklamia hominis]EKB56088.1 S-adenosyl-methyltransferase MraW [Facklamia hominis CCUG 36813]PKY92619.1 16S rRNA (cytosine(1402)-N(4))-methyltransferase RsmH [Facklamia hominis]RYC98204.1 16S rRNA (cytosine(1402)-N(4))-methyltransferase RsmH [Facklamia hominis]WPJ90091.1 16S rRNA (cytosine(1402)-N(4))-methyltransferase RsmH [Facklamia hominis]